MSQYILRDSEGNESEPFEKREKAKEQKNTIPKDLEIIEIEDNNPKEAEPVEPEPGEGEKKAELAKHRQDREMQHEANLAREVVERVDAPDPNSTLPHWMLTEIEHSNGDVSVDLNKRGTQVVANYLDLVVTAECEVSAKETDFEYCRYRATVETPNGDVFKAVGDAHINEQGKDEWDLERLAETRAKKRSVKWSSAGGIAAFEDGES